VSVSTDTLKVRDIWGVVSTENGTPIADDHSPSVLDTTHKYNLYNQGFPHKRFYCYRTGTPGSKRYADVLDYTRRGSFSPYAGSGISVHYGQNYPSNTNVFTLAVGTDPDEPPVGADGYNPLHLIGQTQGNTPAAKGHFIIDPFFRSASRQVATEDSNNVASLFSDALPADKDIGGVVAAATFAQRVFYACQVQHESAIETSPNMNNTILFTQVIDDDTDLGKCYQSADPTADIENALVATDGGTIPIPQAATIYKLVATARSILVFASNGVWEITSIDSGFSATSFEVNKVSNAGCVGAGSVVEAEGNVYYWSGGGVYVMTPNDTATGFRGQNITDSTIASFYDGISGIERTHAVGTYDEGTRKVRWLYGGWDGYDGTAYVHKYNKELVLDVVLGGWTPGAPPPYVAGLVSTPSFRTTNVQEIVYDSNISDVYDSALETVYVTETRQTVGESGIKYLTVLDFGGEVVFLTFSEYNQSTTFRDWQTYGAGSSPDATAYLETGYESLDDQQRDKQAVFLTLNMKCNVTEVVTAGVGQYTLVGGSSCTVTPKWEFSNDAASGKWANSFEGFRLRNSLAAQLADTATPWPADVVASKTKLRGRGKVLRLRLQSKISPDLTSGYSMHIIGWGITYTAGNAV